MFEQSHQKIIIRNLVTEARCGIHPWEQHPQRPNKLIINIELYAPIKRIGETSDICDASVVVDYDHIRDAIKIWPSRPHVFLLETLLKELVELSFVCEYVSACRVSIVKPDIFNEAEAVGVELFVWREDKDQISS